MSIDNGESPDGYFALFFHRPSMIMLAKKSSRAERQEDLKQYPGIYILSFSLSLSLLKVLILLSAIDRDTLVRPTRGNDVTDSVSRKVSLRISNQIAYRREWTTTILLKV